jgi:hypothetical protein
LLLAPLKSCKSSRQGLDKAVREGTRRDKGISHKNALLV